MAVRRGAPAGECGGGNEAALSRRFYGSDRSKLQQGTSTGLHLDDFHFQREEVQTRGEATGPPALTGAIWPGRVSNISPRDLSRLLSKSML